MDGIIRVFERCHQGAVRGMDGGKFKRRLSEVNARAVSKGQNELVCKFQMAAGDMVSTTVHINFIAFNHVLQSNQSIL